MVPQGELRKIARGRLKDAECLLRARRFDGAVYLCGYAVEIALKARICRVLKWEGYPHSRAEFEGYHSFRTHDLDVLLHLCAGEAKIKSQYLAEWSTVASWDPSVRYRTIGTASQSDAEDMVNSASTLLGAL